MPSSSEPASTGTPADQPLSDSQRSEVLRTFASGLAHEGRNALQQIVSCAELLGMETDASPHHLDLVQGILDASMRLNRMFNDLRSYCLKRELAPLVGDVPAVWRAAWNQVIENAELPKPKLVEVDLPGEVTARIVPDELNEAFVRVFENALDSGGVPLEVEIRATRIDRNGQPALVIQVRDSGPGFSEESQRRAFEPFFTHKTHGTGLGLSIVRRILEALGGQVSAYNAPRGGGVVEFVLSGN